MIPEDQNPFPIPSWPDGRKVKHPARVLAWLDIDKVNDTIRLTLENAEQYECLSWVDLAETIFDLNLLVYTNGLKNLPFLKEVGTPHSICVKVDNGNPQFIGIKVVKKRNTRYIYEAGIWGGQLRTAADLPNLRRLFNLYGCGPYATPGSLGAAHMRALHPRGNGAPILRRPPMPVWDWIHEHLTGGRAEVRRRSVGRKYGRAVAWDQNSAYSRAISHDIPCGSYTIFNGEAAIGRCRIRWAIVRCTWRIQRHRHPAYGVLPVRDHGGVSWPTDHKDHESYASLEEIEVARFLGYDIAIHEGVGWKATTDAFSRWSKCNDNFKIIAPDEIKPYVKQIIVASIGRFGRDKWNYQCYHMKDRPPLVRGEPDPIILDEETGAQLFVVKRELSKWWTPDLLIQVAWATHAHCRLDQIEWCYKVGGVIATNFDEIITTSLRRRGPPIGIRAGQWKRVELTNVIVPANRHIISDQKVSTPGVSRAAQ